VDKRGANLVQLRVAPGVKLTPNSLFDERLQIVREADLENKATSTLDTAFFAGLMRQEEHSLTLR